MSHAQNEGNLDARSRWRRLGQTLKGAVFSIVVGLGSLGSLQYCPWASGAGAWAVFSVVQGRRERGTKESLHVAAEGKHPEKCFIHVIGREQKLGGTRFCVRIMGEMSF